MHLDLGAHLCCLLRVFLVRQRPGVCIAHQLTASCVSKSKKIHYTAPNDSTTSIRSGYWGEKTKKEPAGNKDRLSLTARPGRNCMQVLYYIQLLVR
jgi:hypothetical protein